MLYDSRSIFKVLLFSLVLMFASVTVFGQVNTGGTKTTKDHNKEVIGYITNWDAWKDAKAGLPAKGALTQLNIDYSKYTILNFSFFGVAYDGSLHSADLRNKNIYKPEEIQQPADILYTDIYSSWDLHILFGEIDAVYHINDEVVARATAQGFDVKVGSTTWSHPAWGIYNKGLPLPLHKEGGAPGLLELGKANGVKIMASIGGWSMSKHFSDVAADPVKRARFVEDCKKLIAMGFDGIDFDWEFIGPFDSMNAHGKMEDYPNCAILAEEVRAAIGPDKMLTVALSQVPKKIKHFDWPRLSRSVDYFNMMTYDTDGGWSNYAGHNSPLYPAVFPADVPAEQVHDFSWDTTYKALMSWGVSPAKINMGMGFYGRGVVCEGEATLHGKTVKRNETVQPDGPIVTSADYTNWPRDVYDGTPNYFYIKQKTGNGTLNGWTRYWDANAQVPYLTNGKYFLSYDDEESIGLKAEYVKEKNLAGTIVWQVYGDLEFGGTATSFGTKLKRWSQVDSPLVNTVNEIFAKNIIVKPTGPEFVDLQRKVTVKLGETVNIPVRAIDRDGQVVSIEFAKGSTVIAQSASGTLDVQFTPTTVGLTVYTVVARDNDALGCTDTVAVEVLENKPSAPAVVIDSPADNAVILVPGNSGTVVVKATVTDVDGDLKSVLLNGAAGTVAGDLYTFTFENVEANVTKVYEVVATDATGLITKVSIKITLKTESQTCKEAAWDRAAVYLGKQIVCHGGYHWEAKWWTRGEEPGTTGEWGVWRKIGPCPGEHILPTQN